MNPDKLRQIRNYISGAVFLLVAAALIGDGHYYLAIPFGLIGLFLAVI